MAAESHESPVLRAVLIVLGVLMLYVLSLGPVSRHASIYGVPDWVVRAYYPLVWAAYRCDPLLAALRWYCPFWFPPPWDGAPL